MVFGSMNELLSHFYLYQLASELYTQAFSISEHVIQYAALACELKLEVSVVANRLSLLL